MLHVHFARMCMCGRREVTRKTLAETRTARKKKSNTEPTSYFLLKAFLRKALHCAGEGVTTKVPLGQLPTLHYLYIIRSQPCAAQQPPPDLWGRGDPFFLSAMHVCIIHRIM